MVLDKSITYPHQISSNCVPEHLFTFVNRRSTGWTDNSYIRCPKLVDAKSDGSPAEKVIFLGGWGYPLRTAPYRLPASRRSRFWPVMFTDNFAQLAYGRIVTRGQGRRYNLKPAKRIGWSLTLGLSDFLGWIFQFARTVFTRLHFLTPMYALIHLST